MRKDPLKSSALWPKLQKLFRLKIERKIALDSAHFGKERLSVGRKLH